jgi:hypothetical protein
MYQREFEELQRQLAELLENGFIRPSTSLLGALVFFSVRKTYRSEYGLNTVPLIKLQSK